MPFFFSRHSGRKSPPPSAGEQPETSPNGAGFWPSGRRRRRRMSGQTLLPTTYTSNHKYKRPTPTCNSFLMGGQFYPGKDKKRRTMRRRTCWYRTLFSSWLRTVLTLVSITVFLLWTVIIPFTEIMMDYGRLLSGSSKGWEEAWLLKQPHVIRIKRSIEEERETAMALYKERQRVRDRSKRMHILEEIVPKWFHRNSDPIAASDEPPALHENTDNTRSRKQANNHESERHKQVPYREVEKNTPETPLDAPIVSENKTVPHETVKQEAPSVRKQETAARQEVANTTIRKQQNDTMIQETTRQKHTNISKTVTNSTKMEKRELPQETRRIFRTLYNMESWNTSKCPSQQPSSEVNTTLVVQTSLERLWIMAETCSRWLDPIVAVVYLTHNETALGAKQTLRGWKEKCPQLTTIPYEAHNTSEVYPVNVLRNVGLDAVTTSHVLMIDIDFVPSQDLHLDIQTTLIQDTNHSEYDRHALVVPAFERLPPKPCANFPDCMVYLRRDSNFIPKTFDSLKDCVAGKNCTVFQSQVNWEGHSSTRSEAWLQDTPLRPRPIACFDSLRYEPYVVLPWCKGGAPVSPYYDERFHGYGKNKIEMISHLRFAGYPFSVLPKGFIVHNPHPESLTKQVWNNVQESDLHESMDLLYRDFLYELLDKYKNVTRRSSIVDLCKHKQNP